MAAQAARSDQPLAPGKQSGTRSTFNASAWLTGLGVFVAIGVMLVGSAALFASRNDAWEQARRSASNLLIALDRDITRNIRNLDLSLLGVEETLAEPGLADVSPGIRQHALFDSSAAAEDLGAILVLGPDGKVQADSTSVVPHQLDLSDRDYFRVHQNGRTQELFVSRAFQSRLSGGDARFALSRRLNKADGEFAGVVVASIRLAYLRRLFDTLDIGPNGTIALIHTDGRMLARSPFRASDMDMDLSKAPNFQRMRDALSGQYVAKAAIDGVERLYTHRRLGDLPLLLTVSLSTEDILAPWREKTLVIGPVLLVLGGSSVASSILFRREMLRRARSERELAELARQLEIQATTDGLTGLMNRRAFDSELDRAFRSSIRNGTALSVLMLDADYFKRFNDSYGHAAGDNVLQAVANTMLVNLRRPDDRGARYGGEEFVAILPNTDAEAAFALANRVRAAIEMLAIEHRGSPLGVVTVSIGVAATTPLIGDSVSAVMQRADQSLYAAKQAGRNCIRCMLEPDRAGIDLVSLAIVTRSTLHEAQPGSSHS